jgi:predicted porin
MGQWDTPYKFISLPVNPLKGGYVFDRTAITGNPGFGVNNTTTQFTRIGAKADAAFDRRQGNSVQYWTPTWGGFSLRFQHSVNEGTGAITAGGPVIKPVVNAASAVWNWGQLSLRYGYEEHKDYFGMSQIGGSAAGTLTNQHSKDTGQKFVWLYRIGNTRFTGLIERLKYTNDDSGAGQVKEFQRDAWYFVLEQFFANNTTSIYGSYGQAKDGNCSRVGPFACVTNGLGAKYYTLGLIYRLSKRSEIFMAYYKMDNKLSGQYSPGPMVNGASIAPGADTQAFGVGMWHSF